MPGGEDPAGEHVGHGPGVLAGKTHKQHRREFSGVIPQLQIARGVQQQHGPGEAGGDPVHQSLLLLGEVDHAGLCPHIRAFSRHPGQDHHRRFTLSGRRRHLRVCQGHFRVEGPLGDHEALHAQVLMGKTPGAVPPGQGLVDSQGLVGDESLQQRDGFQVVHVAGACASLYRVKLAHAEYGQRGRFFRQRQGAGDVSEQNHAFGGQRPAQRPVLLHAGR